MVGFPGRSRQAGSPIGRQVPASWKLKAQGLKGTGDWRRRGGERRDRGERDAPSPARDVIGLAPDGYPQRVRSPRGAFDGLDERPGTHASIDVCLHVCERSSSSAFHPRHYPDGRMSSSPADLAIFPLASASEASVSREQAQTVLRYQGRTGIYVCCPPRRGPVQGPDQIIEPGALFYSVRSSAVRVQPGAVWKIRPPWVFAHLPVAFMRPACKVRRPDERKN